jgi:hypothetical protein
MRSVASDPAGAPLAMSTDGADDRSLRASPDTILDTTPIDASMALQESKADSSVAAGSTTCRHRRT